MPAFPVTSTAIRIQPAVCGKTYQYTDQSDSDKYTAFSGAAGMCMDNTSAPLDRQGHASLRSTLLPGFGQSASLQTGQRHRYLQLTPSDLASPGPDREAEDLPTPRGRVCFKSETLLSAVIDGRSRAWQPVWRAERWRGGGDRQGVVRCGSGLGMPGSRAGIAGGGGDGERPGVMGCPVTASGRPEAVPRGQVGHSSLTLVDYGAGTGRHVRAK